MIEILKMFALVVLQNASFTLVSRARNSNSILYHTIASVLSNGIWLLVIREVVLNFNRTDLMITYLVGSVTGSIVMHYVAMKWLEKKPAQKSIDEDKWILIKQLNEDPELPIGYEVTWRAPSGGYIGKNGYWFPMLDVRATGNWKKA
jgi:hypothetical protein